MSKNWYTVIDRETCIDCGSAFNSAIMAYKTGVKHK